MHLLRLLDRVRISRVPLTVSPNTSGEWSFALLTPLESQLGPSELYTRGSALRVARPPLLMPHYSDDMHHECIREQRV